MAEIKRLDAVKLFFGGEGYPPVTNKEILELKKEDPDGYEWIATECHRIMNSV